MNSTEKLVKIIQEVVRKEIRLALKEELGNKSTIKESYNPTIENIKRAPKPKPTGNNLQDILNETAYEGEWRTLGGGTFDSNHASTFGWQQQMMNEYGGGNVPVAKGIEGFIQQNNNGAQDIRQVQVNSVPDFSAMMTTMKNKGLL
jgi:hypothetical protein